MVRRHRDERASRGPSGEARGEGRETSRTTPPHDIRVAVVGGGITGLALLHALRGRGIDAFLFEASDRTGGVIRSLRLEGKILEAGPQRTRLVPSVAELVEELALSDRLVAAPTGLPLYVLRDGRLRLVPFSPGAAFRTDLLSWKGKLRLLLEPFTRAARSGETVADFFVRTLGREAYLHLAGPLYAGLYASDPREMDVERSLGPALRRLGVSGSLVAAGLRWLVAGREPPPACSFGEGLGELPAALHRAHGDRVRLGAPVRGLRRDGSRWRVETDAGGVAAERVVLTVPADAAASILRRASPAAARRLARLRYNPLAVVHLGSDCGLHGMGHQVSLAEGTATLGVTWNSGLFGGGDPAREGVYTAYLGGARRRGLVEEPDDRLGRIAAREFRDATGCPARVLRVDRTRMPAWDRSWEALDALRLPAGVRVCASYESRPGIPGRLEEADAVAGRLARELGAG